MGGREGMEVGEEGYSVPIAMEEECWLNMSGSELEHCLVKLMGIGYGHGYGTEDCGYG